MKNFSGITDNLDITTKKYVDDGLAEKANSSDLATVATSGSYNDLSNKLTAGSNISISGNTISATVPTNYVTTDTEQTITSKKTFNGEVKFGNTENFQGYYIKRMLGSLGPGTRYADLDSSYKDGTWHRMWRLRFPSGSSFWGKIKVTLYGDYSSFNASGLMSKSITCNFNTSNIYNNVGCYDGLGVNVEQDFRISEAIWNATANAWEVLIWQKNLSGNNPAVIMLECWTKNNTNYIKAFNGITAQTVELTQMASYSAQRASSTGGTKTVEWATLPVYENPLGEEIATMSDLSNKANLNGGNTFTGKQTLNSPASDGYSINAAGYIKGSWLQSSAISNKGANTGKVCVFDDSGWIYYRTPAEIVAEAGGGGSTEVVQTTGTSTTSVMSQKATTDELAKKANLNGGNNFTGPQRLSSSYLFLMGDDNYQGPLLDCFDEANQSDSIFAVHKTGTDAGEVRIGDASATAAVMLCDNAGTSGQVFTSQGSGKTPIWANVPKTEVVQTTGTSTTSVMSQKATTDELAKKANLDGANEFTDGTNTFRDIDGTTQISGSQVILKAIGVMGSASLSVQTDNNNEVFRVESDSENGVIHLNKTISLNGDMGTSGQVLTSQGASATPQWKSMPTYSLSGTTLTITLP